jgi:hypothetical protein
VSNGIVRPAPTWVAVVGGLALAVAAGVAGAAKAAPDKLPLTQVQDLSYGDVLFYFYQGESFESLTRLLAYSEWGRVPHHEPEAQLLLGGMYLELGMHNEAGQRFEQLLKPEIPAGVRNRAWFYLAKIWYVRGYDERAEQAVRHLEGKLPAALESERMLLLSNVLMRQQRFAEAAALLNGWQGPEDWAAFARFNLGVALVRQNQLDEAAKFLGAVGNMNATTNELLALRDRANLALGFAYLQAGRAADAKAPLQRVRLNGTYSSRALLGAGWADAELGDFRGALTPWLELKDRNLLDAAVQESFLAVPYAFGKLEAPAQAAEYYETAIQAFIDESGRIDAAIARIRSGGLLDGILAKESEGAAYGWFWQLKEVPDAPESRYLYTVLASHDFQEGLKNYRDLAFLDHTLGRWAESFDAYRSMIDTREAAFAERLPRADALLASAAGESLVARRNGIEARLDAVAASADVAALGNAAQRDQWDRVRRVEESLAAAPDNEANAELRNRLRLVKGALFWRLAADYRGSMFGQRRALRDVDGVLRETQDRWEQLGRARASVPQNTGEFGARVDSARVRLEALRARLAVARRRQNEYLAQLAVNELSEQKARIAAYQVQARFSLAAIYDRAATPKRAPPPAAVPAPPPAPQASGVAEPAPGGTP